MTGTGTVAVAGITVATRGGRLATLVLSFTGIGTRTWAWNLVPLERGGEKGAEA